MSDQDGDRIGGEPIWFDNDNVDYYPLVHLHWKYNVSYPIPYEEHTPENQNTVIHSLMLIICIVTIVITIC